MINTAMFFVHSVFTFYTFYRYGIQQNEFYKNSSLVHLKYEIFTFIYTFMVIRAGSAVNHEVSIAFLHPNVYQALTFVVWSSSVLSLSGLFSRNESRNSKSYSPDIKLRFFFVLIHFFVLIQTIRFSFIQTLLSSEKVSSVQF